MRLPALVAALVLAAAGSSIAQDAAAPAQGDPAAGAEKARVCKTCHNFGPGATNKIGPVLNGVVGRQPGTYDSFNYSDAMKQFGTQNPAWTPELLAKFLDNPRGVVPGTKMTFPGLHDPTDLANVIAYLETLGPDGQPVTPAPAAGAAPAPSTDAAPAAQ